MTCWGVVNDKQMVTGRPNLSGPPSLTTQINLNVAGHGWNQPGDGEAAALCSGECWWGFKAHLNFNQAAKFDHSV